MTRAVYIRPLEDRHMEASWPGLCIRRIETLRHKKYVFPIQGVLNKPFKLTPLSTNNRSQFQPNTNTNLVLLYRIYNDDSRTVNYSESVYTSATEHPSAFLYDTWSYSVWFPVSLPRLRFKFYALNALIKIAFCMVEPKSYVLRRWTSWACRRRCISCRTDRLQKLHLQSIKCDVLKCLFTPLWSEYFLKHWKHVRGFSALRICFLVESYSFSHDIVGCSSGVVLFWVFGLGTCSSLSDGAECLHCPQRGPPSWKLQYWIPAATALLCCSHLSSSKSVVGHVKNVSTRRICSGGIVNSFCNTLHAGWSLTVPSVSCLSILITACFQLNSHCASFCCLSCR